MAQITHTIRLVASTAAAIAEVRKYEGAIVGAAQTVEKHANTLSGDKLLKGANEWTAAVAKLGGASKELASSEQLVAGAAKLTDAEKTKLNATLTQAIAKYQSLGQQAPAAMLALADATKSVVSPTDQAVASLKNAETQLRSVGSAVTTVGTGLTAAVTVPLAALGGFATKAAMDFESSFAGVGKTVDGVMDQFGKLTPEGEKLAAAFRQLALEIPVNVNELNKIGEAAGALGIPQERILDFTKTMAILGETTNLSSDQAATAIAKIQNIFGAAGVDTDRFASALVGLGNAGASTETEIVEMAARIAGAGNQVGLTQAQVLGFASALASVGIEAEMGGSAISRVFLKINDAVMGGGEKLTEFARVSGMSVADFKKAFEQDAASATNAFIGGLARIKSEGENVNATLGNLSLGEIRVRDTLMRLSGASKMVGEQLALSTKLWEENTAAAEEAQKRFATTESMLKLLGGQLRDVGITIGNALLPMIRATVETMNEWLPTIRGIADAFAALPMPLQVTAVGIAAVAAALGPLLLIVGQVALGLAGLAGAFAGSGTAATVVMSVLGALVSPLALVAAGVVGLTVAVRMMSDSWADAFSKISAGAPPLRLLAEAMKYYQGAVETSEKASAAQRTGLELVRRAFEGVKASAGPAAVATAQVAQASDGVAKAVRATEVEMKKASTSTTRLVDETQKLPPVLKSTTIDASLLYNRLQTVETQTRAVADAMAYLKPLVSTSLAGFASLPTVTGDMQGLRDATDEVAQSTTSWLDALGSLAGTVSGVLQGTVSKVLDLAKVWSNAVKGMTESLAKGDWVGAAVAIGTAIVTTIVSVIGFLKPQWKRIADDIGRDMGVSVSESLAKEIEKDAKRLGDRVAASLLSLPKIIAEAGGVMEFGWDKAIAKTRDLFVQIERGKLTVKEAGATFNEMFSLLATAAEEQGGIASQKFLELIDLAQRFGVESKAAIDFLTKSLGGFGSAMAKVIAATTEPFDGLQDRVQAAADDVATTTAAVLQLGKDGKKGTEEWDQAVAALSRSIQAQEGVLNEQRGAAERTRAEMDRLGSITLSTINAAIARGVPWTEAIEQNAEAIDRVIQGFQDLGIETDNVALKDLIRQRQMVTGNQTLFNGVNALSSAMEYMSRVPGALNLQTFQDMQRQGQDMYSRLQSAAVETGGTTIDALRPMVPFFQNIEQAAAEYGFEIDANTQMLIDQARELGLMAEQAPTQTDVMKRGFDAVVGAIRELTNTIRGIPGALQDVAGTAVSAGRTMVGAANDATAAWAETASTVNTVLESSPTGLYQIIRTAPIAGQALVDAATTPIAPLHELVGHVNDVAHAMHDLETGGEAGGGTRPESPGDVIARLTAMIDRARAAADEVTRLTEEQKTAITTFADYGASAQDIATALGLTVETVDLFIDAIREQRDAVEDAADATRKLEESWTKAADSAEDAIERMKTAALDKSVRDAIAGLGRHAGSIFDKIADLEEDAALAGLTGKAKDLKALEFKEAKELAALGKKPGDYKAAYEKATVAIQTQLERQLVALRAARESEIRALGPVPTEFNEAYQSAVDGVTGKYRLMVEEARDRVREEIAALGPIPSAYESAYAKAAELIKAKFAKLREDLEAELDKVGSGKGGGKDTTGTDTGPTLFTTWKALIDDAAKKSGEAAKGLEKVMTDTSWARNIASMTTAGDLAQALGMIGLSLRKPGIGAEESAALTAVRDLIARQMDLQALRDMGADLRQAQELGMTTAEYMRWKMAQSAGGDTSDTSAGSNVPRFANGTGGFLDFGAGTLAMLHGREKVVPEGQDKAEDARFARIERAITRLSEDTSGYMRAQPHILTRAFRDAMQQTSA